MKARFKIKYLPQRPDLIFAVLYLIFDAVLIGLPK
jgi:hypothetical protein